MACRAKILSARVGYSPISHYNRHESVHCQAEPDLPAGAVGQPAAAAAGRSSLMDSYKQ